MRLSLAKAELFQHTRLWWNQGGEMVMRINWKILVQTGVATAIGMGVVLVKKEAGGPGGMVPGLLGFVIAWIVIPAVYNDMLRRWLTIAPVLRWAPAKHLPSRCFEVSSAT
jgi:hypothetical protein